MTTSGYIYMAARGSSYVDPYWLPIPQDSTGKYIEACSEAGRKAEEVQGAFVTPEEIATVRAICRHKYETVPYEVVARLCDEIERLQGEVEVLSKDRLRLLREIY